MLNKSKIPKQLYLSRLLFIYMLSIAVISVLVYTLFWIYEELSRYRKEVLQLHESFINTKDVEIKRIILEHESYMTRLKYFPEEALINYSNRQTSLLRLLPESNNPADTGGLLYPAVTDAIDKLLVPVIIYDSMGLGIYYSSLIRLKDNPLTDNTWDQVQQKIREDHSDSGAIKLYKRKKYSSDSVIIAVACYNDKLLKGCRVVSYVNTNLFDQVLQSYMIDSLSRWYSPHEEYIFVNTPEGYALLNKQHINNPPEDILLSGDKLRERVFRSQLNTLTHSEGIYYSYDYTRINSDDTITKTSYFSYFPRWGWIIGTGYYHDEIDNALKERKKVLINDLKIPLIYVFFFLCVIVVVSYFLVRYFHGKFKRNLTLFEEFFKRSAKENVMIDASQVKFKEIAFLAMAANRMAESRQLSEKKMNESKAKLEAALDYMGDAVFITDLQGNFIDFNEAFADFCRFKNKSECPTHLSEYSKYLEIRYSDGGDIRPLDKWAIASALRGETALNEEFYLTRKDTGESWIGSYNYAPIRDSNGTIVGAVATAHDITEQKKAEAEIRSLNAELEQRVQQRTHQLETANKELESFSYSVSHDLRAPLRAINGFTKILLARHKPNLDEEGRMYLDYVVEAGNRMDELINDLLSYSRLGRNQADLHMVSLNELFSSIQVTFQHEFNVTGAQFIQAEVLPDIISDRTLLSQIFTNLVSNSIKYRRVEISPVIRIGYVKEDSNHILSISDNGIGIEKEYWTKIFEVFQRLHTEDVYPGTGIGLASVKKGAELLGGSVWVESEINIGSTFFIKLPDNNNLTK